MARPVSEVGERVLQMVREARACRHGILAKRTATRRKQTFQQDDPPGAGLPGRTLNE